MDLITPSKEVIPVSVWARQLHTEEDPRCLVVMEPVERITGAFRLDFSVSSFYILFKDRFDTYTTFF